jgi:hypothetical protein
MISFFFFFFFFFFGGEEKKRFGGETARVANDVIEGTVLALVEFFLIELELSEGGEGLSFLGLAQDVSDDRQKQQHIPWIKITTITRDPKVIGSNPPRKRKRKRKREHQDGEKKKKKKEDEHRPLFSIGTFLTVDDVLVKDGVADIAVAEGAAGGWSDADGFVVGEETHLKVLVALGTSHRLVALDMLFVLCLWEVLLTIRTALVALWYLGWIGWL